MTKLLDESINLGLGLILYSREKVEEMVEELVNKGEIAKKDARQFANGMVKKGEEQREELKKLIRDEISGTLSQMGVAKKQDLVTKDEISQIVKEQVRQIFSEQGIIKT